MMDGGKSLHDGIHGKSSIAAIDAAINLLFPLALPLQKIQTRRLVEPVDTAGGIRAATVRLTQVCRYGPLPMTLVDKFHQKCGV